MSQSDNYLPHLPQLLERWVRDLERLEVRPPTPSPAGNQERRESAATRIRGCHARERLSPP